MRMEPLPFLGPRFNARPQAGPARWPCLHSASSKRSIDNAWTSEGSCVPGLHSSNSQRQEILSFRLLATKRKKPSEHPGHATGSRRGPAHRLRSALRCSYRGRLSVGDACADPGSQRLAEVVPKQVPWRPHQDSSAAFLSAPCLQTATDNQTAHSRTLKGNLRTVR